MMIQFWLWAFGIMFCVLTGSWIGISILTGTFIFSVVIIPIWKESLKQKNGEKK